MSVTLCGLHEYVSHCNMITTAILTTSFANHYLVFPEERCQPLLQLLSLRRKRYAHSLLPSLGSLSTLQSDFHWRMLHYASFSPITAAQYSAEQLVKAENTQQYAARRVTIPHGTTPSLVFPKVSRPRDTTPSYNRSRVCMETNTTLTTCMTGYRPVPFS